MVSPAIRITQLHDSSGAPAPEQYLRPLESTLTFPVQAVAVDFLVRLGARRTERPGEFDYLDPARGSGTAILEGLEPGDVERIDDYFRVEEVRKELGLGRASRQWLDTNTFFTKPGSARNPLIMIVLSSVGIVFVTVMGIASSIGPLRVPGETVTWVYLPLFAVLLVLLVVLLVHHARRLRGWTVMRSVFRARGERMPYILRVGE